MADRKNRNGWKKVLENKGVLVGGERLKKDTEKKTVVDEKGKQVEKEEPIDGEGAYKIVNPHSLYLGKSYSGWTTDWFNWFLSADADKRNSGPVVFLRSHGLPNRITGAFTSDLPSQVSAKDTLPDSVSTDPNYPAIYVNDPNIRIGSDRLQIFEDQAVFVPIIIAYELRPDVSYIDWGWMQDVTGLTIDYGDNPPEASQLTINNRDINLPAELEMRAFRITTPVFTAVVPDAQYGRSIKDFLEDSPIAPGNYPAMVEGYFIMLLFDRGSYWVHSWASAPRERRGPYFSELLYQIEVIQRAERDPHRGLLTEDMVTGRRPSRDGRLLRPSRNEGILNRTLSKKKESGELTDREINRFKRFLKL